MTEDVRKLLLEANIELEDAKASDSMIYEQALLSSDKFSLYIWRSLLESYKDNNSYFKGKLQKRVKVLPPEKLNITAEDIIHKTREECDELKKSTRRAISFNSRHDDNIVFAFIGDRVTPILKKYIIGSMEDDGITITSTSSSITFSSSVENFEDIIRKVNDRQKIIEKK